MHPVRFRGTAMPTQHTKTLSPPSTIPIQVQRYNGRLVHCPRCVENWQFSESSTIALNAIRSQNVADATLGITLQI